MTSTYQEKCFEDVCHLRWIQHRHPREVQLIGLTVTMMFLRKALFHWYTNEGMNLRDFECAFVRARSSSHMQIRGLKVCAL